MIKYPGRLTKKQARILFNEGSPVLIVPCKCSPFDFIGRLSRYGSVAYKPIMSEDYSDFDKFVNAFEYYNCNPELGRYAAFYKKGD